MDETWLLRAVAYVELNPVKAGMVERAWDYPWSSVHAHLSGRDERGIVAIEPLLALVGEWQTYLDEMQPMAMPDFERHERTGRPLGDDGFVQLAEKLLGREDSEEKPGPKTHS